mmetsp:Transcript_63834/g.116554  ORF Transcript_63834/g.116554 Transcript_63834/m.116554 type:complete len:214 (-) Transcript_63834:943-1584(-)
MDAPLREPISSGQRFRALTTHVLQQRLDTLLFSGRRSSHFFNGRGKKCLCTVNIKAISENAQEGFCKVGSTAMPLHLLKHLFLWVTTCCLRQGRACRDNIMTSCWLIVHTCGKGRNLSTPSLHTQKNILGLPILKSAKLYSRIPILLCHWQVSKHAVFENQFISRIRAWFQTKVNLVSHSDHQVTHSIHEDGSNKASIGDERIGPRTLRGQLN